MNKKIYIRQGDILFETVDVNIANKPNDAEWVDTKIVAHGEITGHTHSFKENSQVLLYKHIHEEVPTQLSVMDTEALLVHQEHLQIQVPKNNYRIIREQSYNPFLKQIQKATD